MALYKNSASLTQTNDTHFDSIHQPGSTTPFSAIYRCTGCGREIVSEENKPFPPQNHHQHTSAQGYIRWQMTVYADHKPK
jgi:DNA-directed RNA polymerase subunit RPC12/RpoP